jgi:hypothetical protein
MWILHTIPARLAGGLDRVKMWAYKYVGVAVDVYADSRLT